VDYPDIFQLLKRYGQPAMHEPAILLMQALKLEPDEMMEPIQKITTRWLEDCNPAIPAKLGRKVSRRGC
jgi:hypothetical protein